MERRKFMLLSAVAAYAALAARSSPPTSIEDYLQRHKDGYVFHVCNAEAVRQARQQGWYRADSLATDGFIHFAQAHQVQGVLTTFFARQSGLVILVVDSARLTSELRFEGPAPVSAKALPPGDSSELYPHLYGRLNLDAIVDVLKVRAPGPVATGRALDNPLPLRRRFGELMPGVHRSVGDGLHWPIRVKAN